MSAVEREKAKNAYLRRGLQNSNTVAVDDAASRLWGIYRSDKALPKTPTKEEIAGNGAEAAVLELAVFALSRPIPIKFDANLQPTTDTNRCVTGQTLVEYIGKYLKKLREIDPEHTDWKNLKPNESPPWWTSMRKSILNRCYDNQIKWQGQFEFGAADIRPLYLDLGAVDGDNPLRFCDLKHVIMALVKHANPSNKNIEMAAKIMMTYDSISRGGEVKFQKFTDWSFDYLTYVLDTKWSEMKTCDTYAMARVSDKRWWFCFFFIMGAYAMCSNGLYRSEEQIKNGLQYAVFPDLHKYKDNYVTTIVGKWVKQGLDSMNKEVPGIDKITQMFSAKSCRIGAVNQLALHSLITVFNVCARSGHSVGEGVNALQSYLDRSNPILGLPAALALHGYKCIRPKKVAYPKITAVGESNMASMERLISKMFLISIPEFEENGKLRDVLNMFAASLILHYKQIVRDCGPCNQIASKLEDCAVEANITAAGLPNLSPRDVLEHYSDKISKKFVDDMKDIEIGEEAAAKGSTEMMQLVGIASDVKDIKATEEEMKADLATTKQRLERSEQDKKRLNEENAHLKELLQKANEKLSFLKANCSPVRPTKHQRTTPETEAGGNDDLLVGEVGVNDFQQLDEVSNDNYAAKPPPSKKTRNSNKSESFNGRNGDKGLELVTALERLAEDKLVHSCLHADRQAATVGGSACLVDSFSAAGG